MIPTLRNSGKSKNKNHQFWIRAQIKIIAQFARISEYWRVCLYRNHNVWVETMVAAGGLNPAPAGLKPNAGRAQTRRRQCSNPRAQTLSWQGSNPRAQTLNQDSSNKQASNPLPRGLKPQPRGLKPAGVKPSANGAQTGRV